MSRSSEPGPSALIRLAPGDEVLVAVRDLVPGTYLATDGEPIRVVEPIALGHKVAARALARGERVRRCGVPIGSMSAGAGVGAWVHTHNLQSDYIPTFAQRGGA